MPVCYTHVFCYTATTVLFCILVLLTHFADPDQAGSLSGELLSRHWRILLY